MQEKLIRLSTRALFAATWVSVAPQAFALSLGDIEVRSALGDPLDARVPLGLAPGEVVDATCFALAQDPEPGVPVVREGLLTVERAGDRSTLRIRSQASVFEPAVRVRVRAACPGQSGEALRQYSVLLDPRHGDPVVSQLPVVGASLDARSGDTLRDIATKVFPRNSAARDRYLHAMRDVNPALASLADGDPIPAGANVALPDLRTFSSRASAAEGIAARPATTARARERAPRRNPRTERKSARVHSAAAAVPAPPAPARGDFALRLSGDAMDLSRTREVDDRTRAQLRERLMILESDDQVAAVLALRNRLTQLEARVNELQLKLAQMPASFPVRSPASEAPAAATSANPARAASAPAVPASVPSASVAAPSPSIAQADRAADASPATATAKAPAAPEESPTAAATKDESPTAAAAKDESPTGAGAKTDVVPPAAEIAEPPQAAATPAPSKPVLRGAKPGPAFDFTSLWRSYGLWAAFIGVLALLMLLAWRLTHRREPDYEGQDWEAAPPIEGEARAADEIDDALDAPAARPEPLTADAGALRQRYIEERFPEVLNGTLTLGDPASIVKVARLFYEDGAMPRAVELLHFAIEENPAEVRPWLALFEIYRLERMTGEFAELARRFYEHHGNTEYWRKIRYFGREIDPGNFIYREDVDVLETIGPGSSRRARADGFDPARENWLDAPMDFDNDVLANELRQALMAGAGVVDQDLVPNPMPALRDAEMFTVA